MSGVVPKLVNRSLGNHAHRSSITRALDAELNVSFGQGEQCVIATHADIFTGMERAATLANNNITGQDALATVALDAESFGF